MTSKVRLLVRGRDLADLRYGEPVTVDDMARAAGYSRAHFSRAFRLTFGQPPHAYLITRRLERAASLLRITDRPVVEICHAVGWDSVGSFTSSFSRTYGLSPARYRLGHSPASAHAHIPACVLRVFGRPRYRTFREDAPTGPQ